VNRIKRKSRRANKLRRTSPLSIFQRMSPAQSREARAIAYEAALAVIG
jgi:hypothetical protein